MRCTIVMVTHSRRLPAGGPDDFFRDGKVEKDGA
jgi:hypothetical protein